MADDETNHRNAMSFAELLSWAWTETPPVHRRPANLLIHLFAILYGDYTQSSSAISGAFCSRASGMRA